MGSVQGVQLVEHSTEAVGVAHGLAINLELEEAVLLDNDVLEGVFDLVLLGNCLRSGRVEVDLVLICVSLKRSCEVLQLWLLLFL